MFRLRADEPWLARPALALALTGLIAAAMVGG
jgi:hypothetical protein